MPPLAVSVALWPLQIVCVEGETCAFGRLFTLTVPLAIAVQLAALLTVTVYVVDEVGLTVIAAVVAVVLHKYDVPPDAVNVVLCPLHIAIEEGVTEAVGEVFTVTKRLAVAEQLAALLTVTV